MSEPQLPKDPITTAIEKTIEEAAETAREFGEKLLGPAAHQVGGILADRIAFWRFKNRINVLLRAKAFLEEKGISPRKVLPKTALAILEGADDEDQTDMQAKWAAMLVYAADPSKPELLPALPQILKALSHQEVKALERLAQQKGYRPHDWNHIPFEPGELQDLLDPDYGMEGVILMDNLQRLGVVESGANANWVGKDKMEHPMLVSQLGIALLDACHLDG